MPFSSSAPQATPTVGTSGDVLRLTLDQAVATALKQNTTAQTAVLTAAQSEQDRKIALSELLPSSPGTLRTTPRR